MTASRQDGYTIVEVMIFLIISSVLLLSALGMFNGRIARTQFTQSVQALDTKLKSTANETATGTYPSAPDFNCSVIGGQTTVTPTSAGEQGTRQACMFVGKIINFGVLEPGCLSPTTSSNCTKMEIYTVVGRRTLDALGTLPNGLIGAKGTKPVIATAVTQTYDLGYSMRVTAVYQKTNLGNVQQSGLGFFQTINGDYSGGSLGSGAQTVEPWMVKVPSGPVSPVTATTMDAAVRQEKLTKLLTNSNLVICLRSGSTDQNASITLSSASAGGLTTSTVIGDPQCP